MALAHQTPRSPTGSVPRAAPTRCTSWRQRCPRCGTPLGREVLAAVDEHLESLAEAPLGAVAADPVVVLHRRAARVLRLLPRSGAAVEPALLHAAVADLRDPCTALLCSCAPLAPKPEAASTPAPATTHQE